MTWQLRVLQVVGCLLVASLLSDAVSAQSVAVDAETTDVQLDVKADSVGFDQRTNTIVATGTVVIRRGESELRADEVRLNRQTNEAEARGHVSLTDPDGVVFAEQMQLNLDQETGELLNALLYSPRMRYSLQGDQINKEVGQRYRITNGKFTTCQCENGPPSWSIAADHVDVSLDGLGFLEGARFNVLDVPILYLPRAIIPVNRERQSGLLLPRTGISNRRGFQIVQPIYWAINKSHDATVGIDIETSARIGAIGEYRYAIRQDVTGEIVASYFNETIRGSAKGSTTGTSEEADVPENRWGLSGKHTQRIGTAEAYADFLIVGDDLFLREINTYSFDHDKDVALRTRPFTESRVGLLQRWDRAVLQAEGVYYQDLINRQGLVLQRAPEIRFDAQKHVQGLAMVGLRSSLTNFQREEGIAGLRADLQPTLEFRAPLGPSVSGIAGIRLRESVYQLTEREMEDGFRGTDPLGPSIRLAETTTRESFEVYGRISTGVSRIFEFPHLGLDKLKHTIEPAVSYRFIPAVSQNDIMVFDTLDRIDRRNHFTYGIESRLLGRAAPAEQEAAEVYELGRLSISQSYDLKREIPRATESGEPDHLSDIDFALRINPIPRASLRFLTSLDPTSAERTTTTVGARYYQAPPGADEPRLATRTSVGVAYRFITDNPLMLPTTNAETRRIDQIDSDFVVRLTDRIGFLYANRYDIQNERFLENHFGIRFSSACDCWSIDLGFTDKSNPNELELRAQISLLGLGSGMNDLTEK